MKKFIPILVVMALFVGISASPIFAQEPSSTEIEEVNVGITPDSPFYFLDDFWKSVRLTFTFNPVRKVERRMEFAQEKLAEAEQMAEENKDEAMGKALSRYQEQIERAQRKISELTDKETKDKVADRIAEATAKHFDVLERIRDKAPEQAREALERARDASENGHLEALRAFSEKKAERAAELTAKTLERKAKMIEKLAEKKDKFIEREAERFERFAEFAEELRAKFQDNAEVREKIRIHLEEGGAQRDATLRRVLERVPEQARDAIRRALDQSRRIDNPRDLEEIKIRMEERSDIRKENAERAREEVKTRTEEKDDELRMDIRARTDALRKRVRVRDDRTEVEVKTDNGTPSTSATDSVKDNSVTR